MIYLKAILYVCLKWMKRVKGCKWKRILAIGIKLTPIVFFTLLFGGFIGTCIYEAINEAKEGDWRFLLVGTIFIMVMPLMLFIEKINEWSDKHLDD